jgi:curli biogenesis system outer membrane secretion channel CsgG
MIRRTVGRTLLAITFPILVLFTAFVEPCAAQTHRNVLFLDGKGGFVQLPTGFCDGVTEATVETWVKWEGFNKWSRVFDFGREGNASMVQNHKDDASIIFEIRDRSKTKHQIQQDGKVDKKKWHHIAAVSGSSGMRFYIDGNLVGSDSYSGSLTEVAGGTNYIGKSNWPGDELFHGHICEFRFWARARTQAEIRRGMYLQMSGSEPGLDGYWRFDNAKESRVKDMSGNGRDAMLVGTAAIWTTTGPGLVAVGPAAETSPQTSPAVAAQHTPPVSAPAQEPVQRPTVAPDPAPVVSATSARSAAPASAPETRGNALYLDGRRGYVQLPAGICDGITGATVETWVRWAGFNKWSRVLDFGREGNAFMVQNHKTSSSVIFEIRDRDGGKHQIQKSGKAKKGKWHHIAVVSGYDGMKFYIDGDQVGSDSYTGSLADVAGGKNYIGKSNWPNDKLFHGHMHEFRIWNRPRTQDEIRQGIYSHLTGTETGLIGCWRFDLAVGDRVPDLSSMGRDAVLMGTAAISTAEGPPIGQRPPEVVSVSSPPPVPATPAPTVAARPTRTPTASAPPPRAPARRRTPLKRAVAVFSFEDKTDGSLKWWNTQSVGDGMSEMLLTALVRSGRYRIMERQKLAAIMQEQQLAASGAVTEETAARMGNLLGVEALVIGAVTEFGKSSSVTGGESDGLSLGFSKKGATVAVDVRFVSTSTGEILAAENVRVEKSKRGITFKSEDGGFSNESEFDKTLVGKAARESVEKIVGLINQRIKKVPWQCKVVKGGEQVYISAGLDTGVRAGDQFVVYRPGDELIDPDTGISLGSTETRLGIIQVDRNDVGQGKASVCSIVEGSGYERGDIVRER